MRIAWAFTGAGHLLLESVEVLEAIVEEGHEVTILLSGAAEEVLKMYGLFGRVRSLSGVITGNLSMKARRATVSR